MHKLFFPIPGTYAVAQLDIEGTLRGLAPDAQALEAVRAIRPARCLVYLHNVLELPFPQNEDFKYELYMVGAGLRPANDARCITEDMCAPIFPNTDHPSGRAPLRPQPEFPFSNCYHWFGEDTELDVRVKRGVYDPKEGEVHVVLPGIQHAYMEDYYQDDNYRVLAMRAQRAENHEPSSDLPKVQDKPQPLKEDSEGDVDAGLQDCGGSARSMSDCSFEGSVAPDAFPDYCSSDSHSVEEAADIFGLDRDSKRAIIPVVDCWLNLAAHMQQDEIQDPFVFIQECRALSEIVKDLQIRQAAERCDEVASEDGGSEYSDQMMSSASMMTNSFRETTALERMRDFPRAMVMCYTKNVSASLSTDPRSIASYAFYAEVQSLHCRHYSHDVIPAHPSHFFVYSTAMHKLFFPLPMTYAVIQLDVAGTLRDLDPDTEALEAVRSLRPLKCLVYLHTVLELPFPQNHDFKYEVFAVGPGLRPTDEERCITEDMCVPIFPATEHPTGRAPIRPKPSFPFSNCYQWFGVNTHFDVRIKGGIYDAKEGEVHVELSGVEQVHMDDSNQEDCYRIMDLLAERKAKDEPASSDSPQERPQPDYPYDQDLDWDDSGSDATDYSFEDFPVLGNIANHTSPDDLDLRKTSIDVFGLERDEKRAMIPVVECWLDLATHLKDDEIPDPFVFVQECRALSRVVEELRLRQAHGKAGKDHELPSGDVEEPRSPTVTTA